MGHSEKPVPSLKASLILVEIRAQGWGFFVWPGGC